MNSHWDDEVANETLLTPLNTQLYPQITPKKTPQDLLRRRELEYSRKLKEKRDIEEEKTKTNRATQVTTQVTTQVASKESLAWLAHLDTTPWSLNF